MSALSESLTNPSEEHAMLRKTVRQLAREVVEPQAMAHDEQGCDGAQRLDGAKVRGQLFWCGGSNSGGAGHGVFVRHMVQTNRDTTPATASSTTTTHGGSFQTVSSRKPASAMVSSNKIIAKPKIFAAMVCRNGI